MEKKAITDMSLEALNKTGSRYKGLLVAFCMIWAIALGILLYVWFMKPDRLAKVSPALMVTFMAAIPSLPMFTQLMAINKELKKRKATT